MLVEPVGHLFQGQSHILEADFLAHNIKRHGLKAVVHGAHDAREDCAVSDSRIKYPHRGRVGLQVDQFAADAIGDHPFFGTGVDEQKIFLTVVEESEILFFRFGIRFR